ncbi:MAG: hypothetical protein JRF40_00455 [Deltaproteobacteria bacterium]|nr:hypothetical protein [Deltaproteobacteria bacterium]MBW2217952.1 hypothetical protein [Deltaproteobacteria bacterium]
MGREKRRKFYQKEIELYKSIFSFFIIAGAGAAILAGFYIFISTTFASLIVNEGSVLPASGIAALLGDILTSVWPYVIIGCILLICIATIFTHRFAGPLYRFEVSLDRMISSDLRFKIVLRKKDECKSLADKINLFNSGLSSKLSSMTALVTEVDKHHIKLKEEDDVNETLEQAIKLNQKLKKMLAEYKF